MGGFGACILFLPRPLLHYNSLVFCISGKEHILLHYGPLEATVGNKVSPSPLWQISPCMTADCRGKMAALERRTCTIILRNWHHNPRFATVALVHFVLSNVTAPSSDFCLKRPYVEVLLHLCVEPVSISLRARHIIVKQTERLLKWTLPPPLFLLPPPQQDIAQWHNRVMAVRRHVGARQGQRCKELKKKEAGEWYDLPTHWERERDCVGFGLPHVQTL